MQTSRSGPRSFAAAATLAAGAVSVANGSYLELRTELDALTAFVAEEARLRELSPQEELDELTGIYLEKGLSPVLARQVAESLPVQEALEEHAIAEMGVSPDHLERRPIVAAALAAVAFAVGTVVPIVSVVIMPDRLTSIVLTSAVLLGTALSALIAARSSKMRAWHTVRRALFFGAVALVMSTVIGQLGD